MTYEQLLNELEKYRSDKLTFDELTKEQKELILQARTGQHKVTIRNLCKFFKDHYGVEVPLKTMTGWVHKIVDE